MHGGVLNRVCILEPQRNTIVRSCALHPAAHTFAIHSLRTYGSSVSCSAWSDGGVPFLLHTMFSIANKALEDTVMRTTCYVLQTCIVGLTNSTVYIPIHRSTACYYLRKLSTFLPHMKRGNESAASSVFATLLVTITCHSPVLHPQQRSYPASTQS